MAHWLDRWTQGIAPRWTLQRVRARQAAELLARHYEAAAPGRRTSEWRRTARRCPACGAYRWTAGRIAMAVVVAWLGAFVVVAALSRL